MYQDHRDYGPLRPESEDDDLEADSDSEMDEWDDDEEEYDDDQPYEFAEEEDN